MIDYHVAKLIIGFIIWLVTLFHVLSRNKSMKKCQYIQGKKYEKQRNSEKMWRFDDFVGTSEHRVIGSSDHRNLNGIYTDFFLLPKGKKSLRKSSLKNGRRPEMIYSLSLRKHNL